MATSRTRQQQEYRVLLRQIVTITLLFSICGIFFLPSAGPALADDYSVSIIPSVKTVEPETSFNVTVAVDFDTPTRGGQCALNFNPTYLRCDNVSEGTFYQVWSDNNSNSTVVFPQWDIDNSKGRVTPIGIAVTGLTAGGPTGSGDFCYYYFTAKTGVTGSSVLQLVDVVFTDEDCQSLPGLNINNGKVIISLPSSTTTQASDTTTTSTTTQSSETNRPARTTTPSSGTTQASSEPPASGAPAPSSTPASSPPPSSNIPVITSTPTSAGVVTLPLLNTALDQILVDLSGIIDSTGTIQKNGERSYIPYGKEGWTAGLEITGGTLALTPSGKPLQSISLKPNLKPPSPPSGDIVVGTAVDLGPAGATFKPAINFTFRYEPEELPENIDPNDFILAYVDAQTGKWYECDYSIDTVSCTVTGKLEHFTTFAILAPEPAGQAWNPTVVIIVSELVLVLIVILFIVIRRRSPVRAAVPSQSAAVTSTGFIRRKEIYRNSRLEQSQEKKASGINNIKTRVEVINGKFVFTREDKLPSIVEIVNMSNSHINISVEYDAENHPEGITKITINDKSPDEQEHNNN